MGSGFDAVIGLLGCTLFFATPFLIVLVLMLITRSQARHWAGEARTARTWDDITGHDLGGAVVQGPLCAVIGFGTSGPQWWGRESPNDMIVLVADPSYLVVKRMSGRDPQELVLRRDEPHALLYRRRRFHPFLPVHIVVPSTGDRLRFGRRADEAIDGLRSRGWNVVDA